MSFDLEGKIDGTSLPQLIHTACSTRETGVLRMQKGRTEKNIYLKEGRIVFATSNDRDDRLGPVLLRTGAVSFEKLTDATEEALATGTRVGKMLVDKEWLEPRDLVAGVMAQVREILFSVFQWSSGDYQLRFQELPTKEVITLNVNTPDMMLEGIRRIQSWYRIQEALGGLNTTFHQPDGAEKTALGMKLAQEELSLLTSLERPASLREICAWSTLTDFEVGRTLWAFLVTGLVSRAGAVAVQGLP
jgi:hypothetical protein